MRRSTRSRTAQEAQLPSAEEKMPTRKKMKKIDIVTKESIDSSSDSDIETYLKKPDELDLDSTFFKIQKPQATFENIEKEILSNTELLNHSDSENTNDIESSIKIKNTQSIPSSSQTKLNFQQLHDYTSKIEEVKKSVAQYQAKKQLEEKLDITNLLAVGEAKDTSSSSLNHNSSDFESYSESEKEDWEEIEDQDVNEKNIIPKDGVQITVQLPSLMKKKKGIDLMACMKRRLNRIKKEHQVLIHKVHLLCWVAHGNYINNVLNEQEILGLALSLIPSENCYPAKRTDLKYLQNITKWYHNTIQYGQTRKTDLPLNEALKLQINKKTAFNKQMLVYIFICMLRSLGIQCRLVLSFQVEPLRPPNSELCSLSTKSNEKINKTKNEEETKAEKLDESKPSTSKQEKKSKSVADEKVKVNKKELSKNKNASKEKSNLKNKRSPKNTKQNTQKSKTSSKLNSSHKNSKTINTKQLTEKIKKEVTTKNIEKKSKKNPTLLKVKMFEKQPTGNKSVESQAKKTKQKIPQLDGADDSSDYDKPSTSKAKRKPNLKKLKEQESNPCPRKNHPKRLKSAPTIVTSNYNSEDEFESQNSTKSPNKLKVNFLKSPVSDSKLNNSKFFKKNQIDVRNDIINLVKSSIVKQKQINQQKLVKSRKTKKSYDEDNDSDYVLEPVKKKKHDSDDEFIENIKPKVKKRIQVKKGPDGKLIADVQDTGKKKDHVNWWVEVFVEEEEKWISADVTKGKVHCINEIYTRATHPISYTIAWDNNNNIKDITKRYCPNWNTITRKLRVDSKWWEQTLKPFRGLPTPRDREEDEELARQQLEQPLPKTITEYKDHPLYVLKRHLLKFQAIYPPDAIVLGFIRTEPVYSRECVYTLHSREIWLKHAKVVKLGEKPYKIVKARPKYDKLSNTVITDQLLEIFGIWQVDDYVPPTAENGIVPRNAYGNVELFKQCMLPKKTVHLQLPGLNKVAKKMNIDCAPAVVGFDFHSGWSHPTFDGFVVCEEHVDSLIAAWHIDQEETEKKEQEKIEKRVYGNWKRLIRGLLIRERLKVKYNFSEPSKEDDKTKKKVKGPKFVIKKKH